MDDLIKSLRSHHQLDIVDFDLYLEAATALEAQHALVALLRASLRQSEEEVEGLRRDAERYRWLEPRFTGADFDWNDQGVSVLVFEMSKGMKVSRNIGECIDAALSQTKEQS